MNNLSDTHPTEDQLVAFDRGQLSSRERTVVEQHIALCATCCELLERVPDDSVLRLVRAACAAPSGRETSNPGAHATQSPSTAPSSEVPAELIDHPRYRILGYLGSGGMGSVFKAEHRLMDRTVALKVIKPTLLSDPAAFERFRLEMKATARLSHPAIVAAYDAEQAGDLHFLVTEFIDGVDLDRLVRDKGLPSLTDACNWIVQAALGLHHAHERGMVHRDVKPANMVCTPAGRIKVLDFGLARHAEAMHSLTAPDIIVGTPDYMAPEQALQSKRADRRSDVYSLGATLYYLLTGRPPFPGGSALRKLMAHQQETPTPLATLRPEIPEPLVHVVERMMAKAPTDRYQTAAEAAEALSPFTHAEDALPVAEGEVVPVRMALRLGIGIALGLGVVMIVGIILGISQFFRTNPPTPHAAKVLFTEAPLDVNLAQERSRLAASNWFETHRKVKGDSDFMRAAQASIDQTKSGANSFHFAVGANVMRSGKTTLVVVNCGQLIEQPLSDAQAKKKQLEPGSFTHFEIRDLLPLPTPAVELFDLSVESPTNIDPAARIRGSVSYRLLRPISGEFALRFTNFPSDADWSKLGDRSRKFKVQLPKGPGEGRWDFSAPPMQQSNNQLHEVFLFLVDLCALSEDESPTVAVSQMAATLLEVAPK
jgi:tRNA A-37 threonylcarbamoyl transferase component Bud32